MLAGKRMFAALIVVAVALTLAACGSETKKKQSEAATTTSAQTTPATQMQINPAPVTVENCLTEAGLDVVANGDAPMIERSKAVGVRLPGGANIMPGNLSAAIFWYGTDAKASHAKASDVPRFPAVTQVSRLVVVYDPIPPADAQKKIEACIGGGA
ncbi:MAG TPA: hypothetical protein VIJ84_04905 [Gaiellaceae bacterium]